MRLYEHWCRRIFLHSTIFLATCFLFGCTVVGPRSISMGRADYNEVINRTEDEQMLLSIVKGRYGETSSLLAVSGVAANVRFSTSAGIEAGFGSEVISGENLLIGGMAYEENPTITYEPVQGEKYIRQLMTPIPLDFLFLIVRSVTNGNHPFILLVNKVNGLRNPDFLDVSPAEPDLHFLRFVELFKELSKVSVIELVGDRQKEVSFNVVINDHAPKYSQKVIEFLSLLGLPMQEDEAEEIVIPVYFAIQSGTFQGIVITTRSTFNLIEILRAAVIVPQEHAQAGLTINYPPMGWPGKGARISSSTDKPKNMSLAVKYRGYWFFIDEADHETKAVFRTLRTLWSIIIAGSISKEEPILTIPVSR